MVEECQEALQPKCACVSMRRPSHEVFMLQTCCNSRKVTASHILHPHLDFPTCICWLLIADHCTSLGLWKHSTRTGEQVRQAIQACQVVGDMQEGHGEPSMQTLHATVRTVCSSTGHSLSLSRSQNCLFPPCTGSCPLFLSFRWGSSITLLTVFCLHH